MKDKVKSEKPKLNPFSVHSYLIIIVCLIIHGCDESFIPIQENPEHPFTIYGHLDSSLETNWIRVTPVRENLYLDENATTEAVVTLEHIETGNTSVLRDSLFGFQQGAAFVRNWQTTMPIIPTHSYRLEAKKPDGRSSHIIVTLPDTFPDPVVTAGSIYDVYIKDVENVADVSVYYKVRNDASNTIQNFRFRHVQDAVNWPLPQNHHQFRISPGSHFSVISNAYFGVPYTILKRWVCVASAGPEWVNFEDYDEAELEIPDRVTNIEGGAGFLFGVVSKSIEF